MVLSFVEIDAGTYSPQEQSKLAEIGIAFTEMQTMIRKGNRSKKSWGKQVMLLQNVYYHRLIRLQNVKNKLMDKNNRELIEQMIKEYRALINKSWSVLKGLSSYGENAFWAKVNRINGLWLQLGELFNG